FAAKLSSAWKNILNLQRDQPFAGLLATLAEKPFGEAWRDGPFALTRDTSRVSTLEGFLLELRTAAICHLLLRSRGEMLSSPRTPSSASGLKRRRQAHDSAERRPKIGALVPGEPSREAQVGWGDDFPLNFKVLSKIGEGSFGTVWTAKRTEAREGANAKGRGGGGGAGGGGEGLVALKRINPTCSPSRILNEFEQMRKLGGG
ncbi:unnamed protein product, partial [Laminaria digitata]